jgi:hypothetical protein
MVSVFANASITIIAQQGEDANYGLHGLRGISLPRQISQGSFRLDKGYEVVHLRKPDTSSPWFRRGWTYQEGLFSRRKLCFNNDAIRWECPCNSFQEDVERFPGQRRKYAENFYSPFNDKTLTSTIPSLSGYEGYVRAYNVRELTFPEDASAAFAGIINVVTRSFHGGFICGLPALFWTLPSAGNQNKPMKEDILPKNHLSVQCTFQAGPGLDGKELSAAGTGIMHVLMSRRDLHPLRCTAGSLASGINRLSTGTADSQGKLLSIPSMSHKSFRQQRFHLRKTTMFCL